MLITKVKCPTNKIAIKCPYSMIPEGVTVHNTANDASAMSEISYMLGNNLYTSFHYAVDDYRAVQGIEENRNGFHASDGANGFGNRKTIAIEICYSKSGGDRFIKAEQNAAELVAGILKKYGWGIDKVKRHYDYAPNKKYCPHRTMDLGWQRFLNMVNEKLNGSKPSTPSTKKIDVKYQVYAGGKWWSDIVNYNNVNSNGYAGYIGKSISGLRANTVGTVAHAGHLQYRVHRKNGGWLGWITDRQKDKYGDDFAGILGKPIDGVQIKATKGTAVYRVHLKGGKWLSWVSKADNTNEGYAGIYGKEIDAIQVYIKS